MVQLRYFLRFALVASITGALLGGVALLTNLRLPSAAAQAPLVVVVTNSNDSGPGSLRQAILDVEPGGTILFDPSLAGGRIVLTLGQLVISRSLTIDASTAVSLTVDANRASRVFLVTEGATVELIALRITGGQAPVNDVETIGHGGGILNLGGLTLTGCTVIENRAGHGQGTQPPYPPSITRPGGDGGGIYNAGWLIVQETAIISNTAGAGGESYFGDRPASAGGNGGGLFNSGILEIKDSVLLANRAGEGGGGFPNVPRGSGGHGGGLYNTGVVTITRTSLTDNMAGNGYPEEWPSFGIYFYGSSGGNGGGIYSAAPGRLALNDSTLQSNTAGSGRNTVDRSGGTGGGLYSSGMAWITNSVFVANRAADCQVFGGSGGAIANQGTLVLQHSVLDGNASGAGGPGESGGNGGGLWNRGAAHLIESNIVNNSAGRGGDGRIGDFRLEGSPGGQGGEGAGIWNDGLLLLSRVTVDGNRAGAGGLGGRTDLGAGLAGGNGGSGGGLWNSGQLGVFQSTISRNRAGAAGNGSEGRDPRATGGAGGQGGDGGGVYNRGQAALINSTMSSNAAGPGGAGGAAITAGNGGDGGRGGGIFDSYSLTLSNVTITANSAAIAGQGGQGAVSGVAGVDGAGGGVYGVLAARDTILAGNASPRQGQDCAGRLYAGSHNLIESPQGCAIDPVVTNNVVGRNPALLPLALNAPGTTAIHALALGSPAIDAGSCSAGSVTHDQRGVARPQGPHCDIGAYEFDSPTGRLCWLPFVARATSR